MARKLRIGILWSGLARVKTRPYLKNNQSKKG
jgi:hypothetical protein